jgi:dolichyl-phosphate beta-glucosyltransferase
MHCKLIKMKLRNNISTFEYAVIVPCYNEEKRFPYRSFEEFSRNHPEVLICLVNDGSRDRTIGVLRGLEIENPSNVIVLDLDKNSGKSEAVRKGMLHVYQKFSVKLLGFLDADLATTLDEWLQMAKYKDAYPRFGAIIGSRIVRLGANIKRDDSRSIFSKIIKLMIGWVLKARFQDTQCGAKIFTKTLIPSIFGQPFNSTWLFDVEILLRVQEKFGKSTLQSGVIEYPLMDWSEIGDSKLTFKQSLKIPIQLMSIFFKYKVKSKPKAMLGYR